MMGMTRGRRGHRSLHWRIIVYIQCLRVSFFFFSFIFHRRFADRIVNAQRISSRIDGTHIAEFILFHPCTPQASWPV